MAPCLERINSHWTDPPGTGETYDRLPEPRFRGAFLKRWGYRVADVDDPAGRARLVKLRTLLRNVLEQYIAGRPLPRSMRQRLESEINRAPVSMRLIRSADGYTLSAGRGGAVWDVMTSDIAMSPAGLRSEQATVKVCANAHCS